MSRPETTLLPAPAVPAAAPAPRERPGALLRYGAAVALSAAAFGVSLALREWLAATVFIFFFAAVVLAAWYGGRGPALLVTALALPLANYFLFPPYEVWTPRPDDVPRLAVFALVALLIGSMRASLDAARLRAEAAAEEARGYAAQLEEQAAELEVQATELEQQTEEAQGLAEELEEAHRLLRESMGRQLAEAQALAHVGSWEWAVGEGNVRWSDEMYRVYGLEPGAEEVTLASFLERVHPGDRDRVRETVARAREAGEAFEFEHRVVRPDGSVRTLHARGRVEVDAEGRAVRMSGTGQDVTDERAAQEAARRLAGERAARAEAEAGRRRLEAILEGIGEAFAAFDAEWRFTYVNGKAEAALGVPRAGVLGRPMADVFPAALGSPVQDELRRVLPEGRPVRFETFSPVLERWLAVRAAPWEGGVSVFWEDVTGRRRQQETQARLAAIVESSQDAIFSKTLDGVITSWNRGAERLYGYAAAEIVGRPVTTLAPPERRGEIPVILERLSRGERMEPFETVRRRKDGTRVDVLLAISPLADAGGTVVGASTIARDISERKAAEARLREGEESLRFLAEASRLLSSSLDYRRSLAAVLRLAVPRLGDFSAVHLLDADGAAEPVEAVHADPALEGRVRALAQLQPPRPGADTPSGRALASGRPVLIAEVPGGALEAAVTDGDALRALRDLAPRSLLLVPMVAEGRPVGLLTFAYGPSGRRHGSAELALAEDLARRAATAVENARLHAAEQAARRQAERAAARTARLQAVTAALSEARTPAEVADVVIQEGLSSLGAVAGWLVEVTPEGNALHALRARGYDEGVVASFQRFGLDAPIPLADAVRTGEAVYLESPEERARRYPALQREYGPLGNGAWVSVPLASEGRPLGGIGLTFAQPRAFAAEEREFLEALARQSALALERARLFEAEQRARAEAEAANRAKFEFLTTMSHELRTPLNAIAGYVELLEMGIRGPVTEAQRQDLARIRRSQTHLLGLINDVLNFARIETGHVHFDVRDVPLDDTLAEVETLIAPQVRAKGLEYEYCRFDPRVTVRADEEKLRQIILNLLSNAVKFTPPGGSITMECARADGTVEVRVHDTGVGIPADKLAAIFEPFVQVNAGYTRTSEGTGLGLAISRDLARAMGGELHAESREGEGSVFTLMLPAGEGEGTSPES